MCVINEKVTFLAFISFFLLNVFCVSDILVVDFKPACQAPSGFSSSSTANDVMFCNVDAIDSFLESMSLETSYFNEEATSRLVVFPEYSLTSLPTLNWTRETIQPYLEIYPDLDKSTNQSHIDPKVSPILSALSDLAVKYHIYLVICGPGELSPGSIAVPSQQFNTQSAFSPTGELVGKYRKMHLYREPWYDEGTAPATFQAGNWTVGMMICFDIHHMEPMRSYVGVTDMIAVSLFFRNDWPVIGALETQRGAAAYYGGWVAAANNAGRGPKCSGSGIYHSTKVIATTSSPELAQTTHIASLVPTQPPPRRPAPVIPATAFTATPDSHAVQTFDVSRAVPRRLHVDAGGLQCWADVIPAVNEPGLFGLIALPDSQGLIVDTPLLFGGIVACEDDDCSIPDPESKHSARRFSELEVWCSLPPGIGMVHLHAAGSEGGVDTVEWSDMWTSDALDIVYASCQDCELISFTFECIPLL